MKLIIEGELTDLNSYIKALNSSRFVGNNIKKEETERVYWACKEQKIKPINSTVQVEFRWFSKDARKDLDNIAFAKKFILDGLVLAGVLKDDSRKYVSGFSDSFSIDKQNPRVEISTC